MGHGEDEQIASWQTPIDATDVRLQRRLRRERLIRVGECAGSGCSSEENECAQGSAATPCASENTRGHALPNVRHERQP
jgi:hypothetical protein